MNAVLPYHKGALFQKGRGIGGVFNSLFRTLGRKLRKSAQRVALKTAKNLIESGDISKTLRKGIAD